MSNEVDKQLDEILAEHEYKVTGTPKHWNKTPERKALDNELKAKLKQLLTQQEQAARIDELVNTYNANFIHWGDDLKKAQFAVQKRIVELKHARVSTAASPDVKPRKDVA